MALSPVTAPATASEMREPTDRLAQFEVRGLFGQFTHKIPINRSDRITAIIAPNGSGKTLCLRLINALFAKRWSVFAEVDFESAIFKFESGVRVHVKKDAKSSEAEDATAGMGVQFELFGLTGQKNLEWRPGGIDPKSIRLPIERYIPFLTRRGLNNFIHDYTGASYTLQEAVELFGHHLPETLRASLYGEVPRELASLITRIDCRLIETQRLLILRSDGDDYRRGAGEQSQLAISKKAATLRAIIASELTAYAALSQSLDRSFPRRVITAQTILLPENLKAKLLELDEKRTSLMVAGILDSEIDDPVALPEGPLEAAISRVLTVYAEDTLVKLNSLSKLLSRIELFVELINERFSVKKIRVSKENGFEIYYSGQKVPLEKLSSGEQHQLVLFFELLFEIRDNALILIDEPELSLHVAWQKKFIADLQRIIALNQFDVILATHSPQLISRWTNLVVELGEVDG